MKLSKIIALFLLCTSASAFAGNDSWHSEKYKKHYPKKGHCGQYDYTDKETCNTGKDEMQCDWNPHYNTCYKDGHDEYEWYSVKYNRYYKKKGHCNQYNHTDSETCNTSKDYIQCNWDHHTKFCKPAH